MQEARKVVNQEEKKEEVKEQGWDAGESDGISLEDEAETKQESEEQKELQKEKTDPISAKEASKQETFAGGQEGGWDDEEIDI